MKGIPHLLPPFLLLVLSHQNAANCPPNALRKATECIGRMGDLGMSISAETVQPWDHQRTKIACENGAFTIAMDCAANVVDMCKGDRGVMMDIPLMRRAVENMCNQVDEMKPYVNCMHAQLEAVARCAERQKKLFHQKLNAAGGDSSKKMQSACSFTNNVYGCQTNPVRQHCGEVPAKFLLDFMSAFRLPSCPPPDGIESSSPHIRLSLECHIIWITMFVIFLFYWTKRVS